MKNKQKQLEKINQVGQERRKELADKAEEILCTLEAEYDTVSETV